MCVSNQELQRSWDRCNLHHITDRPVQASFPVPVTSTASVPGPLPTSICSRAAAETMGVIKLAKWLKGSSLRHFKLMWNATLEQRVTAESPKGPDCQSKKMDWLIYVFANFSSESFVATRNNGLTLQTWNCHLDVTFSPFIYAIFFLWLCFSYIPMRPSDWRQKHWESLKSSKCQMQISRPALQKMDFTQWLLTTTSSSCLHPDLESISLYRWKNQSDLWQENASSSTFCGRHP